MFGADQIPLWIKIFVTLLVCVIVPVYWRHYGPGNFLWFSDIALLVVVPTLWVESALLTSMLTLSVGVLEIAWTIDFFVRLITGVSLLGLSSYMFERRIPPLVRALSLFHLALPALIFGMVYQLGYDRRALVAQTLVAWVVLPLSYLLTKPSENVNWVYGIGNKPQHFIPQRAYVVLLMALLPVVIYLPTHLLLSAIL